MTAKMTRRKGQSAIEYLMTYGWMLLVVAIVGGVIFATVQGQCAKQATGFTGETITVPSDGFEITPNNVQVRVENTGSDQVTINNATLSDDSGSVDQVTGIAQTLNVGDNYVVTFSGVSENTACNDYDLSINFDRGSITGAVASGTLSGNMAP